MKKSSYPIPAITTNPTVRFGLKLLQKETEASKGKNVLVSPASVAIALAMTLNGARTTTLSNMKSILGYSEEESMSAINKTITDIIKGLEDPASGVDLNMANAIWAEKSMVFKEEFVNAIVDAYDATVTNADFSDSATKDAINKWVEAKTEGKIPSILDSIPPETVMYLLNAIYFKGKWSEQFNKAMTFDQPFVTESGVEQTVPFMHRTADMNYSGGKDFTAVSLPFGDGKQNIRLYIILPNEGVDINNFIASIDESTLAEVKFGWYQQVELHLPRFQLDYDVDLKDSLSALGMKEPFVGGADFTGLADASLVISSVKHKTFAKFDEEGGEAAAVTSVGIGLESVSSMPQFIVERPFVMALFDQQTDTLLFAGKVAEIKS